MRANETYSEAKRQFSDRNRDVLMNVQSPHKWWSPSFTTFAFRSSEVSRLLLDLDRYGGTDPLGMFPLFLKRTADVMAPRLSLVFQRLVRLGSFPACWG